MKLTYTWQFEDSFSYPKFGELTGVISKVVFGVHAKDEDAPGGTQGYASGSVDLPPADSDDFTPIAKIKGEEGRALLLLWAKDALGATGVQRYEDEARDNLLARTLPLPVSFKP